MKKKKKKKSKNTFKIVIAILLILIAGTSIYLGIYFTKLTKPNYIVGLSIEKIDNKITNYTSLNNKYDLGDTFEVNSTLSFDLEVLT